MASERVAVRCCIAGGGPAGMVLGALLARAGVETLVLEKHGDFLRDFRGDTVHPSTLEVMHELGVLDEFLARPHQEFQQIKGYVGGRLLAVADFTRLRTHCRFLVVMPQWDFLDFVAQHAARRYPAFHLRMRAEVTGLVEEAGRVVGVTAATPAGPLDVRADLGVAADGRHSLVRARAGLAVEELGAPMDVLWFRLPRRSDDPGEGIGYFQSGRIFVRINRGDYWQCGYVIAKGQADEVRRRGIVAFRESIAAIEPRLADQTSSLRSWDDTSLLSVAVDRLIRWWRPGLLCIGDAAHAMSPIGGVGINLAVQDAVAAANELAVPLRDGAVTAAHLERVQARREWPTRVTQWIQVQIQRRVIARVLGGTRPSRPPLLLRLLAAFPSLQALPARLIGVGFRPEHLPGPRAA